MKRLDVTMSYRSRTAQPQERALVGAHPAAGEQEPGGYFLYTHINGVG